MDLPVYTGLHSSELLSPPFLPSPSSSRLQGADHGKNQQQRQPNLHSDLRVLLPECENHQYLYPQTDPKLRR